jgi:enoyl-CoA hydratase
MNHRLFTYAKPTVAFMDGITMGGGVGIAMPCRYRVATENTRFAMPETGIGLFPDVGGGWYLSRLPGHLGEVYRADRRTARRRRMPALGLATHYLSPRRSTKPRRASPPIRSDRRILGRFASAAPGRSSIASRTRSTACSPPTLEDIYAALEADGGDWALKELATLAPNRRRR